MTADTERLTHLAALGDQAAAAELARAKDRAGVKVDPYRLLREIAAAQACGDFDAARRAVFALYTARPVESDWMLRWRVQVSADSSISEDRPLVALERRSQDHFRAHPEMIRTVKYMTYSPSGEAAGLNKLGLLWDRDRQWAAETELRRYAMHYARKLFESQAWQDFLVYVEGQTYIGDEIEIPRAIAEHITNHDPSKQAHITFAARNISGEVTASNYLRHVFGTPGTRTRADAVPNCGAALVCVVDALAPNDFAFIRASAAGARIYIQSILTGDAPESARVAKADHARMLAAIYCGCEYSITPKD
jgi:hypothetical protein